LETITDVDYSIEKFRKSLERGPVQSLDFAE